MNHLSNRINAIEESATLAMAAKAREYKSKGIDVISLSLGEPDFKTPAHICEGAKQAIDSGKYFSYPPVNGYQDLREAIAAKYNKENGVPYKAEHVVVSNGAKQSIANVMFALLNPGDEVVVFEPFYENYGPDCELTGAEPRLVSLRPPDFSFSRDELRAAFTPRTRTPIQLLLFPPSLRNR